MTAATLTMLAVDLIDASPDQNRTVFDPGKLAELAASIAETGLLVPIAVRPECSRYVLIAGERRLRAAKSLGWTEIPAILREPDADDGIRTLTENMMRDDPGPVDEANGLADALAKYGIEHGELARRLGKNPRWVRDRLALLRLAADVAHYVQTGQLPIGRGVLMAELDNNRQRLALQAHEHGIGIDAFRSLIGRLAGEQAADSMFDADSFLRVDEYVTAAQTATAERVTETRERACGIAEVAEMLEVKPATVHQWRQRGIFPTPEFHVSGSPAWWESTVRGWADETGRGADRDPASALARLNGEGQPR